MATSSSIVQPSYNSIVLASYTARGFQGICDVNLDLSISVAEQTDWNVSVLKPSWVFEHTSLLFESPTGDTFYVDLIVVNDEVILRCRKIDLTDASYQHLEKEYRGTVRESAKNLFRISAKVLKQLGSYHTVLNNCQNYTEELAKALGCRTSLTDTGKLAVTGVIAAGLGAVALGALYYFAGGDKTAPKKK